MAATMLALAAASERPLLALGATRLRGGAGTPTHDKVPEKLSQWWERQAVGFRAMQPARVDADRVKAAALMQKRGLVNVENAVSLLRTALQRDPENVQLKLELADALTTVCRIRTNANSLVIEGTQDCPEFKKIWGTLGCESLPLAAAARKSMPESLKALAVYADAFLYSSSSQGIVKQALTGVGKRYIAVAKELYKHPKLDSAVGCAFLGGFYNVAPWPVGSKQKAAEYLAEGALIAPTRRNLYYVGVNAYQTGEYRKAVSFFSRALAAPPCTDATSTEHDIADFLLEQSRRGLKLAQDAI
jgi:tetratricopeptide (TPR) repeat protein